MDGRSLAASCLSACEDAFRGSRASSRVRLFLDKISPRKKSRRGAGAQFQNGQAIAASVRAFTVHGCAWSGGANIAEPRWPRINETYPWWAPFSDCHFRFSVFRLALVRATALTRPRPSPGLDAARSFPSSAIVVIKTDGTAASACSVASDHGTMVCRWIHSTRTIWQLYERTRRLMAALGRSGRSGGVRRTCGWFQSLAALCRGHPRG